MSKADNVFVKLFDFRIYNADLSEESDSESKIRCDKNETVIQMYGMHSVCLHGF